MQKIKKNIATKTTMTKIENINIKVTSSFNSKQNICDLFYEIANNKLKEETPLL